MKKFVCMHGHFYQPPRENPWTGEVDEEPSASPFHDWNERIAKECYDANTRAPILNAKGETVSFVNNFELISFDIGPTLLSWLKGKSLVTYRAIVQADKNSAADNHGHGNAMAQVYNHIILPLAKKRDKVTQILWGIADFEHHYGRKPEGMWLSETAVDRESLKIMADNGIEYTVLAPHQAKRVRRIGFGSRWTSLHHESLDTKRAYRILLEGGKQFHIFFYNAPISRAIAFNGLLNNGDQMVHQLMNAYGRQEGSQLVSTATDGESFGHHHHFGEMAIAYGLKKIQNQKLARLTNYADFLEQAGSQWEADIQENSSWSCAHGIERWRSDCGCRLNHEMGWNQKWREVLREALDTLQGLLDDVYESQMGLLVKDPWQARNDYIQVLLDPSEKQKKRFLAKFAKRTLFEADEKRIWDLLEAEKFSLFMFTSCGWFFDDISGIEPVQLMKFALRAIELVQPYTKTDLEIGFKKMLSRARSNIPENGNGADVFERSAKERVRRSCMGFNCGIVGLPNVGKSTIFNALTHGSALAANYPFATIDPNVGIIAVPDKRLEVLTEIVPTKKVVPTTVEIVDIAGIVKGASQGEGLGNQFLSHIAEVDALIQVVRCFEDKDIMHVNGTVDPVRDMEIIKTELILKDLDILAKHKTRVEKGAKAGDKKAQSAMALLERFEKSFNEGKTAHQTGRAAEEKALLKELRFLTDKPILYAANVAEDELGKPDSAHTAAVRKRAAEEGYSMIKISGKVEEEISRLEPAERAEFLKAMNMEESGLHQLAREGYKVLNLITFFTVGETENRAWTVERASSGPQAAGKIHSDFEKGFIRAEVISYDDFVRFRGEQGAKEKGRFRLEGKEYIVQDGDVMHFRFSV